MYDVLIFGGSAAGMSCALILGSAKHKSFAENKRIGIIMHQKSSALQNAELNNVLGLAPQTKGADILEEGRQHLNAIYNHVEQIDKEKVISVKQTEDFIVVKTNKNTYETKAIVVALGASNLFNIKGLESYIEPHRKLSAKKERIQLKNKDHKVASNIYVAGVLAGWRSQFAIACGSGASVATDILTEWNDGNHAMVHDKIKMA
ncbi:MAG: NAD(P)/FAD-dependent oxidoreductase [Flavobacteriaceae bacterium]|nr:NAD(P)/FAD-dependent oxidoreductase [Flavobacteriaceae bacterium]